MKLIKDLDKNKVLFAYGRNAIFSICKSLKIKKGDEILTPALDCDSTLTPFIVHDASLVFYKSDPYTFNIDIDDLEKKITEKTKLIHIINHFGFFQPWDKIEKIKIKYGVPIVEDNAFSFFSTYNGKSLGTFGDFSVFSLYKIFNILNGGLLVKNNDSIELFPPSDNYKWVHKPELYRFYKSILSSMLPNKVKNILKKEKKFLPPIFSDEKGYPRFENRDKVLFEFSYDYLRPISKFSRFQLEKFDKMNFYLFLNDSRLYYSFIVKNLKGIKGLRILHPKINKEVVPFCVMLLVEKKRDVIIHKLLNEGFSLMAWPNFSKYSLDKTDVFKEVEIIGKQIIQINISNVFNGFVFKKKSRYFIFFDGRLYWKI